MRAFLVLAFVLALALPGLAQAGPGSDPVGTARSSGLDDATATLYETFPTRRIGYDDENRTVYVYEADTGRRIGEPLSLPPVYLHSNGTDHARLDAPGATAFVALDGGAPSSAGFASGDDRATLCLSQATEGLDGLARGARCNGDIDGDGEGDVSEVAAGSSPIGSRPTLLP